MSRATPRKPKHRQTPSGSGQRTMGVSDYESDAFQYVDAGEVLPSPPAAAAQLPPRSNTDLNLSVLRRYLPTIRSIVSIAANAVVYNFSASGQNWEKSGVEGTMFVCEQEPVMVAGHLMPRACVFVLNRRGLNNVVVELCQASICQKTGELIVFRVESSNAFPASDGETAGCEAKVIGLWLHADEENTREVNAAVITDAWNKSRLMASPDSPDLSTQRETAVEDKDPRRKLSISDLFGQRNGLPI